MWFDDTADKRVGKSRVAEALATGACTLAVSCPFCLTMTTDGIAARNGDMLDKRDQPKFTEEADWKTEFKLD